MTEEVKTCVGCLHSKGADENQIYNPHAPAMFRRPELECGHPKAMTRDPVYGKTLCYTERSEVNKKGCGPKGKLWEPRKKD